MLAAKLPVAQVALEPQAISLLPSPLYFLVHLQGDESAEDVVATTATVFLDRRLGLVGTQVLYQIAHAVKDVVAVVASVTLMDGVAVLG